MFLWDTSPLSLQSAGFLNKVTIICPNNVSWFTGLSRGEQYELGLSDNRNCHCFPSAFQIFNTQQLTHSRRSMQTPEGHPEPSCHSSWPVQTCTHISDIQRQSMGRKEIHKRSPWGSLVTMWLRITCDLKLPKMAVQAHRELSTPAMQMSVWICWESFWNSETENAIGYDEQRARFLCVTWSSRKEANIKGAWTQFQGPTQFWNAKFLFLNYVHKQCLPFIISGRISAKREMGRRFITLGSIEDAPPLQILVPLLKVQLPTVTQQSHSNSPITCLPLYLHSMTRTPPPYLPWTLATVVDREQTHTKNMQRKQSFQYPKQCSSTRVHNVL